ncbi:MAG TPA: hypothetical protein PLU72_03655 [Candidatus Ozemobacteraceae bacterium]|nr:hypothetical protein [Candidatus Ozemobacteraceae bacterium]HQG29948.1 hypothetical protein [Candidatus Ozemobacteraceae bacterium]
MRYKTFRALVILGLLGIAGGGLYEIHRYQEHARDVEEKALRRVNEDLERYRQAQQQRTGSDAATTPARPSEPADPAPAANPGTKLPAGYVALRPMDVEILAAAGANISGDKVKDAIRGRPWKVNLFKDAGQAKVNRLKIDLDRDDKWDEKWSWDPEGLQRQVAPADDERYTIQTWYDVNLNAWSSAKPATGPAPTVAETAPGIPSPATDQLALRPMDAEIISAAVANISGDKAKDAVRGRSWKVNLYKDAGQTQVNRAKVDLDRDDKWDEKWTWKNGTLTREVASNDDEAYDRTFILDKGGKAWLPR